MRRLFISKPDEDYDGVGWIINEDITGCMVCAQSFGFFRWPHHCRCCGNLVCNSCSPEVVVIFELKEMGPVRVCIQCYWGQDPVHVSNLGRDSENASIESDDHDHGNFFTEHELNTMTYKDVPNAASLPRKQVIPVPAFVLETIRKLSFQEVSRMNVHSNATRKVYINICMHSCVPLVTHGGEYYIDDDVVLIRKHEGGGNNRNSYSGIADEQSRTSRSSESREDKIDYEVYHVLVDPQALRLSLVRDPKQKELQDQVSAHCTAALHTCHLCL